MKTKQAVAKFECDGCKGFYVRQGGKFSFNPENLNLVKAGYQAKILYFHCDDCQKVNA